MYFRKPKKKNKAAEIKQFIRIAVLVITILRSGWEIYTLINNRRKLQAFHTR